MQQNPVCPYCNKLSELVKGDVIYPHRSDLFLALKDALE